MPGSVRGGIVPASPRSCDSRKSSDGLSESSKASDSDEFVIARRRREKRMEEERKEKGFQFEELDRKENKRVRRLIEDLKELTGKRVDHAVFICIEELIGNILEGSIEYDDIETVGKIYTYAVYHMVWN